MSEKYIAEVVIQAVDKSSDAFTKIDDSIKKIKSSLDGMEKNMQEGLGKNIDQNIKQKTGLLNSLSGALAKFAAPLAAAYGTKKIIDSTLALDKLIVKIKALKHATDDQMQSLVNVATATSEKLGFSTYDLLHDAALPLAKRFDIETVAKILPAAGLVAKSGQQPLGQATDTLSNVINLFKHTGNSVGVMGDKLAKVIDSTSGNLHDFNEFVKNAGATAVNYKIGLNEFASIFAVLKDTGTSASTAGQAVKNFFTILNDVTNKANITELAKLGITPDEVNPNNKNPTEIIDLLRDKSSKLTPTARNNLLDKLFGRGYGATIGLLLNPQSKSLYNKQLQNQKEQDLGANFSRKNAEIQMNSLSGGVDIFKAKIANTTQQFRNLDSESRKLVQVFDKSADIASIAVGSGITTVKALSVAADEVGNFFSNIGPEGIKARNEDYLKSQQLNTEKDKSREELSSSIKAVENSWEKLLGNNKKDMESKTTIDVNIKSDDKTAADVTYHNYGERQKTNVRNMTGGRRDYLKQ